MTDVRIFCRRCGSVILGHRTQLVVGCGPLRWRDGTEVIDLCEGCLDAFKNLLRSAEPALAWH